MMQVWAIVVIAVSAVVAVIALSVLVWLWVRPSHDHGEAAPLLGGPNISAAAAAGRASSTKIFQSAFLDPDALLRVVNWVDEVIRQSKTGDGLTPLPEHLPSDADSNASGYLGPGSPASMLTPSESDVDGLHTPRVSGVLTPRVSNFDASEVRGPLE